MRFLLVVALIWQCAGAVRLLIVGDTGGIPILDTTLAQKQVSKSLAKVRNVDAVINLGDNFYFTGVMDVRDSRFKSRFADVYKDVKAPWYMIAGNHDHFGNVSAQIEYSHRNPKWHFPHYYYPISFEQDNVTVHFLMIDTIILCGNTADVKTGSLFDLLVEGNKDPEGPADLIAADEQWAWIERTLNTSKADYLFVGGHYPIHSISSHGPSPCLKNRLDPLLRKFNVTAYFAGHDHSLQHIVVDGMNYLVSGAASRSDTSTKHIDSVPQSSIRFRYPKASFYNPFAQLGFSHGGYIHMTVVEENAQLTFHNEDGSLKYATTLYPRNSPTAKESSFVQIQ